MRKDKKLSLEEHMQVADDLAIAFHHLKSAFDKCQKHYPKSYPLMGAFFRVHPGNMKSPFCRLKSFLEEEYHDLIIDSKPDRNEDIYGDLDKRYKKLKGSRSND